ncbi:MAG: copper chaperone PCu(A)C [Comamonadaceae bacterium]|nr:MAG: copper chaperone PCu(A)C [Comamonadaceae bacterium]
MTTTLRCIAAIALLHAAAFAHAQVTVTDPWVRATVPQQKATGAFMRLQADKASKLLSVSSPLTSTVEVHEMSMQGDVMRMRQVPAVALPAGQVVELKPGGYHVMLMNLSRQVKEGETVPLTLVVEGADGKRATVEVKAPVRALNAGPQAGQGGHKH